MKGKRQLTREQRVQVATILIQAAVDAAGDAESLSAGRRLQLAHGLAALRGPEQNVNHVLDVAGLDNAFKNLKTVNVTELAAAWELILWPHAIPSNKKVLATA